jgi:hypothetical protein
MFRENGLALYADPRNAAELGRHNTLSGYLKEPFGPRACRRKGGRLRGAAGVHPAKPGKHAGADCDAHPHPRHDPCRHLPRLRTSFPAFDRASLQGRPEFRRVPADHLRRSGRYRRSRPFLQLRRGEGGAGAAATSRSWWNAAAARCASTCEDVDAGLAELARAMDAALQ